MSQESNTKHCTKISELWHKIFGNNLSIKILSILGAVLVWLLIININDPYKTKNFLVQVSTINEEALTAVNKVYEITEGSTANVSVRGRRSVVDDLDASDINAVADLSELSDVNAVAVKASLKKRKIADLEIECTAVLKVTLEDMATKQVKITVDTTGEPAEGFSIGECVAKPNSIEVTGGESVIDRISTVRVSLNVNGASGNFTKRLEPVAYDKRDNRVTSSTLIFSTKQIRVHAKVLQKKTIPVHIQVSGKPAKGYEYVDASCLPESIEVAGKQKVLEELSQIVIPLDLNGLTSTSPELESEINIEDYLPAHTVVEEEFQKVFVKVTIEKLQTKKIQLRADHIKFNDLKEGCVAGIYNTTGVVDLTIQGRASIINALPDMGLDGYIDCSGLGVGSYMLPVKMHMDKTCSFVEEVKVPVIISKKPRKADAYQTPAATPKKETQEPSVPAFDQE